MSSPIRHILLVEDHADTLKVLSRALLQQGFVVYPRSTSEEALARESEHEHLDLAILDVVLPGLRGDLYGANLRSRFPRLPIIFITAEFDLEETRSRVPDAQILRKPVDVAALLESYIW